MAGSKSDYLENKVLDHVLSGASGAYTQPSNVFLALFTTNCSDSAPGTEVSTSGTGYARVQIACNTTNFPLASGGSKTNGTTITFPQATASWGTVVSWALMDAATGGNMLWQGTMTQKTVDPQDTLSVAAGQLTLSED